MEKNKADINKILTYAKVKHISDKNKNNLKENFISSIGFKNMPSAEEFAQGGFKRSDVIFLIELSECVLHTDIKGKNHDTFHSIVGHFFRNGSHSCLFGEEEKKKKAYSKFIKLIKVLNSFDDKDKLIFLGRLSHIKNLHKEGNFSYRKGSNWINVMIEEVKLMSK